MAIADRTRRLLWGRAANRRAICRSELVIPGRGNDRDSIVGEECHIVAREEHGPRGISDLTKIQRDQYENLILLCNLHHKLVDEQVNRYTIEELKRIKLRHERWVQNALDLSSMTYLHRSQKGDSDLPVLATRVAFLPTGIEAMRARRESDGSILEVTAADSGHVAKDHAMLGAGLGFSLTNNSGLTIAITHIWTNVLSSERLIDVEYLHPLAGGGGAEINFYCCELLPEPGMFECRFVSEANDYVKVQARDIEAFEMYLVERSFEDRLYRVQPIVDFIWGTSEYRMPLEPVSVAFIDNLGQYT